MIFETHAHYDDESFNDDREALIRSLPEKGIGRIINVGASIETTKTTLELAAKYDYIYAAVGVHPSDISGLNEETFAWLKEQTSLPKTVAIGEIGLDYYWDKEPEVQNAQRYWFRRQMELARETNLPVIIHSRDAAADTMEVMKAVHAEEIPGVIHCYSYSREMAQEFINDLFSTLRERMLDLQYCKVVFVGGGAILLKRQIETSGKVGTPFFVPKINANADGYEYLYRIETAGR